MPRLTQKHQVTVPKEIRRKMGLKAGSTIRFVLAGDRCYIEPTDREPEPGVSFHRWKGYLHTGETTAEVMRELRDRDKQ